MGLFHSHSHHSHSGHSHSGGHHSGHRHPHIQFKSLGWALAITLVFMGIEAFGGYIANSLALFSDALHMASDAGALTLSLFILLLSKRKATPEMSFGYHRLEILGALVSGLGVWLLAGFLVYEAVQRMASPPEVQGLWVIGIATIGLLANIISMRVLFSVKEENLNLKAAYVHLFADLLGSVGAMIAGVVLLWTGWRPIDPIVTLIFSFLMFLSSWDLIKESFTILMQSTPRTVKVEAVKADLAALPGVEGVHDLHIWSISSGRLTLSVHLIAAQKDGLIDRATHLLQEKHGIGHATIQVEGASEVRAERCYDCSS